LRERALVLLAASTWFAPERVVWSQVGRYRFCAEHNERRTVNCLRRSRTLQNGDIAEACTGPSNRFGDTLEMERNMPVQQVRWLGSLRAEGTRGRKPIWGQAILRRYIRPVA